MTTEIEMAFAHPEVRATATAHAPRDRISLRDHIVDVEIGAFQAERDMTQRISFSIVVEVRPATDDVADDVDRILSYDRVTEAIDAELAAERLNLLETLADRVAERILREPPAMRVFVRIEKLDRGGGALGVEIVRERAGDGYGSMVQEALHPRVVLLSDAAIASTHFAGWLDQLAAGDAPVILCVGAGDVPAVASATAQRRIDLLAIEQVAWFLMDSDPRCVVVGTMTELDWGMRNGQLSVWAPSKIVMDAVDGPDSTDAGVLAAWFARFVGAVELVSIGRQCDGARIVGVDEATL